MSRGIALASAALWCCSALGTACTSKAELPAASADAVADDLVERMPAITRCWTAGDKRGSHLAGEEQPLRITVLPNGKVKTAFLDAAHNKHPVGSCVRSAFDGLRFARRDEAMMITVPLRLGAGSEGPSAGVPSASQAAPAAP